MRRLNRKQAFVVGFIATGATLFAFRYLPWCGGDGCTVQSWMGALSGWVAAAAAFITLRVLLEQVRSQTRQIQFMLGENPPRAEHWKSSSFGAVIRITNWNRTKFIINAVRIESDVPIVLEGLHTRKREELSYHGIFSENFTVDSDGKLSRIILIPGWENQNQDPPEIFLVITSGVAEGPSLDKDDPRPGTLHFLGHLSGPLREKILVSVTVPLGELLFV
ncbi:hypothetical protein [Neorhizobium tomejilense]|uniref:hypothetical protein n=1 Tax=Neorhizobium tomejilense TaxID=2093828 RepID=UPI000CFA73D9|nr:hypothetical protein [Neorhizobium tomejilense]